MATVIERNELGLRQFGERDLVRRDPRAELMYYLDCICMLIDLTGIQNLARLRYFS